MKVLESEVALGALNEDMEFPSISSCLVLVLVFSGRPGFVGAHFTRPVQGMKQASVKMMKTLISMHTFNRSIDRYFLIGAKSFWSSNDLASIYELVCDEEGDAYPGYEVNTSDVQCVDVNFHMDGTLSITPVNSPGATMPAFPSRWRDALLPPPMVALT